MGKKGVRIENREMGVEGEDKELGAGRREGRGGGGAEKRLMDRRWRLAGQDSW